MRLSTKLLCRRAAFHRHHSETERKAMARLYRASRERLGIDRTRQIMVTTEAHLLEDDMLRTPR